LNLPASGSCAEKKPIRPVYAYTAEIQEAFIDFDRIWDALTSREQSQLLALLVSKVEFDQSDCTIAISFHASGIETLEQQSQEV